MTSPSTLTGEAADRLAIRGLIDAWAHCADRRKPQRDHALNGQSTITVDADRGTGETYCLAHHLWVEDGQRTLLVLSIRYLDTFARRGGQWLFAERQLIIDWADKRPSAEADRS